MYVTRSSEDLVILEPNLRGEAMDEYKKFLATKVINEDVIVSNCASNQEFG